MLKIPKSTALKSSRDLNPRQTRHRNKNGAPSIAIEGNLVAPKAKLTSLMHKGFKNGSIVREEGTCSQNQLALMNYNAYEFGPGMTMANIRALPWCVGTRSATWRAEPICPVTTDRCHDPRARLAVIFHERRDLILKIAIGNRIESGRFISKGVGPTFCNGTGSKPRLAGVMDFPGISSWN